MHPSRSVLLGLSLLCAGCSPYSYSKEVASISDGVNKVAGAFSAGYDNLAEDRAKRVETTILDTRPRVLTAPSCDRVLPPPGGFSPCALYVFGTPEPSLSPAEQTRAETTKYIKHLKDYANALAAVTNAADRSAYDAAVAQLSGAIGGLAQAANPVAPGIGAVAPAAVNLLGWLFGTALDQQRYESLRRAVTAVGMPLPDDTNPDPNSPIRVVARTFGKGLLMLKVARLTVLQNEVAALVRGLNTRGYSDEAYRRRLTETQTTLAVLDALRRSDPIGVTADLADAHDKLVLAINDPGRNYASLIKAVGDFHDKASALQAAMAAMSKSPASTKGN